jgi:hypothetical protein
MRHGEPKYQTHDQGNWGRDETAAGQDQPGNKKNFRKHLSESFRFGSLPQAASRF